MVSPDHARVFCETSVWMLLPLGSALRNGELFFAGALMLTTVASRQHWARFVRARHADAVWHNLDRLGVVLVLSQVHVGWWPLLALLFGAGAALQRVHAQPATPPRAGAHIAHFWCHVLCRYVAFWACCFASGHMLATRETCQLVLYSGLYAVHIYLILYRKVGAFKNTKMLIGNQP